MGKWSIKDLDKSKTEQSIANEQNRLDECYKSLKKLKVDYERKSYEYRCKLSDIEDRINALENSIESGEKFIRECNEHLILDFKDAEDN